jgi:riboflavin-specific deaminase-like protein
VRRVLPEPGETTIEDQISELDFAGRAPADRPYLVTNFALTLDGHATIGGRSGPIGSEADTEMLVGLRTRADAVMIGAGTMRAERYGPISDALLVIVSGRLDLPWDAPLFTDPSGRALLVTAADTDPPETAAEVEVLRQPDGVDFPALLRHLRSERGVGALLCEGGPRLHAQLIDAGLVDELFVTHAPKLAGGAGPGLVTGLSESQRPLELAWLLEHDGELFARYLTR